MQSLAKFLFSAFSDAVDLAGKLTDFARGTINLLPLGLSQYRPFKNFASAGTGSRLMFPIKDTHGGLDDIGLNEAHGSLFTSIAESLFYIGNGQVIVAGAVLAGAIATSILRITLKYNGSYTDAGSATYTVGLNEPSTPTVGSLTTTVGGAPTTNGTYSFRIARLREVTGGKSRASGVSAVLTLVGKGAYIVMPLASAGQTRWIIFVTEAGLGGIGLHFRLPTANPYTGLEYYESEVQRTVTITNLPSSFVLEASSAPFTAQDLGKRVNALHPSTEISFPDGTVITEVISATQVRLSNVWTYIGGTPTVELIAYAGGVDRSVVINWRESDLAGEAAELDWIYDFPPPAGSHAFQLESRIGVVTMADSKLEASGTNAGTAIVFSLSNQLESFDLRFPLYFPGQFIDVIGRGIDSYSFIGLRNGIYCLQYINSDTIPATVSVLLPTEGITHRRNWTITGRALYIATGKGTIVRIGEGSVVDRLWFDPIRRFISNWAQADINLINHPNGGVLICNKTSAFFYDEQTNRFSGLVDLRSTANNAISGIGVTADMFVSMENYGIWVNDGVTTNASNVLTSATATFVIGDIGEVIILAGAGPSGTDLRTTIAGFTNSTTVTLGATASATLTGVTIASRIRRNLYKFDAGGGTFIIAISPYVSASELQMAVQQINAEFVSDKTGQHYIAIHKNNIKTHFEKVTATASSSTLKVPGAGFTSEHVGMYVYVKSAGAAGAWLLARVKAVLSSTSIQMGTITDNLADSVALNASTSAMEVYCLMAYRIFPVTVGRDGTLQLQSPELYLGDFKSVAASIFQLTNGIEAQPINIEIFGEASAEKWTNTASAKWGGS